MNSLRASALALALALALAAAAGSAHAVTAGTASFQYEFLDFSGTPSQALQPMAGCSAAGSGLGSGANLDYRCDPMLFDGGLGGLLTATSPGGASVYQNLDKQGAQFGLGVVAGPAATARPWVDPGEVLTLSFANMVNLVGYHVYQVGNAPGADHFKLSVDGGAWTTRSFASVVFPTDNGDWLTGQAFSFMAADAERFYLGAVKITSAVPEPQTYALMLAGLAALGLATRRRRQGT